MECYKIDYIPSALNGFIKSRVDIAIKIFDLARLFVSGKFKKCNLEKEVIQKDSKQIFVRFAEDIDGISYNRVFIINNSHITTFVFPFFLVCDKEDENQYVLRLKFSDDRSLSYEIIENMHFILQELKRGKDEKRNIYSLLKEIDIAERLTFKEDEEEKFAFYEEIMDTILFFDDGYARRDLVGAEIKSKIPHPQDHLDLSYFHDNYDFKIELSDFETKHIFDLFNHQKECFCLGRPNKHQ